MLHLVRRALLRSAIAGVALAAAGPGGRPALAQATHPVRYRATIDAANAAGISLITGSGQSLSMKMAADAVILALIPSRLQDIRKGSFIGAAAVPQPDGTQRALEVHVFPEAMRGTGEGHRPFDLQPGSTMTNGTVGAVTGSSGRRLTVSYQGGAITIVVPPNVPVVTFEPGSLSLLAPGAHVIVIGTQGSDGSLSATRILVGKNGLVPPM